MRKTQYVGSRRTFASGLPRTRRKAGPVHRVRGREALPPRKDSGGAERVNKTYRAGTFRRRRMVAVGVIVLALALVASAVLPLSWATGSTPSISPSGAVSSVTLTKAGKVDVSTPISPRKLTGLGYHADGVGLMEMKPRGEDLSSGLLLRLLPGGSTPSDIYYYTMDPAGRTGPETGALDVGADAGVTVRSPVSGIITAIRPDPLVRGANLIEIQPESDPNVRVYVSLVEEISSGTGVDSAVNAGETKLGSVADSARVLDLQLSSYIGGSGNHVTISAVRID